MLGDYATQQSRISWLAQHGNRDNTKKDPNQPQKNPCPVQPLSANNLDPRVQAKADDLLARLADDNIIARIGQTLRSFAQQNRLYAQGRTMPGSIVTNARGGDSLHNFGLAFDIQLFDGGGTYITNGTDSAYTTAGYEGMSLNLEWGGQWSKPVDPSHFQFTDGLTLNQVQANSNAGRDVLCHAP